MKFGLLAQRPRGDGMKSISHIRLALISLVVLVVAGVGVLLAQTATLAGNENFADIGGGQDPKGTLASDASVVAALVTRVARLEANLTRAETNIAVLQVQALASRTDGNPADAYLMRAQFTVPSGPLQFQPQITPTPLVIVPGTTLGQQQPGQFTPPSGPLQLQPQITPTPFVIGPGPTPGPQQPGQFTAPSGPLQLQPQGPLVIAPRIHPRAAAAQAVHATLRSAATPATRTLGDRTWNHPRAATARAARATLFCAK